jgi:hypothetical protein
VNAKEATIYGQLTKSPHREKVAAQSPKILQRLAADRLAEQNLNRSKRRELLEPAHNALRAAAENSPSLADIPIAGGEIMRQRLERTAAPKLTRAPTPQTPILKLGSAHLVDVPPLQFLTWSNLEGFGVFSGPSADTSGDMSFGMFSGADNNGSGSGFMNCWAAVGQLYSPPPNLGELLTFTVSPSFSWSAFWMSNWWRQAAGSVWIGQVINRFDSNGVFIDTPVVTQNQLFSFDDYNFSDVGSQSDSSSGDNMSVSLFVESDLLYECWVWAGGNANSDWSNSQSLANVVLSANASMLTLDLI